MINNFTKTLQYLLLTLALATGFSLQTRAQAPGFEWVKTTNGNTEVSGQYLKTDSAGNIYVAGHFEDTAKFGNTVLGSTGNIDVYIAKYSKNGTLLWAKKAGGVLWDYVQDMAVDAQGNIYITGYFLQSINFENTTLNSNSTSLYIAKYSSNGALLWAKTTPGSFTIGFGLAVDNAANIFVTGAFGFTATFGSTILTTSNSGSTIFIAKYDSNGNCIWAQKAAGTSSDYALKVKADALGNIYVAGYFESTVNFGNTTLTSIGNHDVFIAKYNSAGTCIWAQRAGGLAEDQCFSIALDAQENIYISGGFQGNATFGNTSLASNGQMDAFIAKYSNTGACLWAQRLGGVMDDNGYGITVDTSGNAYIAGVFADTASVGSFNLISNGKIDGFIAKYSNTGACLWAEKIGGAEDDAILAVTLDTANNIYITGGYTGNAILGSVLATGGVTAVNMFLAKLGGNTVGTSKGSLQTNTMIYPNPFRQSFTLQTQLVAPNSTLKLIDATGKTVYTQTINLENGKLEVPAGNLPRGMYLLQLTGARQSYTARVVKE